ncbi:class I diheme cytochrome c [Rubellimicrobium mesophilum DSM 19309]|uniref:Class I diheme cytochrome c n=1 Tax=Rubellimicrobium mesophilum DSM 19309 TaxID=442562 RepID=A0A017HS38_9RHOB|nr:c-type cytochrome [Rubellimicrobium mesophilum]EYD76534.1 class I diheme cytochrome c [Rubellimicrobium mesophilum DSM 19309]
MRLTLGMALLALAAGGVRAEPSLERGTYLVEGPMACGNCHTPFGEAGLDMTRALAGRVVEQNDRFTAIAPNITPGGRVADWSDEELARAIREGIRPGDAIIGPPMPMELYHDLSDDDVMSVVLYLRRVPAVENDPGQSVYAMPRPAAYGPPVASNPGVPQGATVEYGAYIAGPLAHCLACHTPLGPDGPLYDTKLGAGGVLFEMPDGSVVRSVNITPTRIGDTSDEELDRMIRTGVKPDGHHLAPVMPFWGYAGMTEDDMAALILYLRALPPRF